MSTSKIVVELTKTGARVESVSLNGSKTVKTVSVADLASVFARNAVLDSGLLPTNDGICYYGQHSNNELIVYTRPPLVRSVYYRGNEKPYRVPVPRTYFFTLLAPDANRGTKKLIHTKMFAGLNPVRRKTDYVYHFPFCNVWEDGRICWGANQVSPIRDLYGVEYYYNLFWDAKFNGDLERGYVPHFNYNSKTGKISDRGDRSVNNTKTYFEWAEKAQAKEYDSNTLRRASTFQDIINGIARG